MVSTPWREPLCLFALAMLLAIGAQAQQTPIAAMFDADQKLHAGLSPSFMSLDVPSSAAGVPPLKLYLSAGDLQRAFDRSEFRPEAAIIPTNTDLVMTADSPATQRVLMDRVRKHPELMRSLEDQIAARRKQAPAPTGKETGVLRIGVDTFLAHLQGGSFPRTVCLIATDFAKGGAIDRRELFTQDRVRMGIAACLAAVDAAGAQSVVLPLMGAASSGRQAQDAMYEGQRVLKECRLLNAVAGIGLGVHDFAAKRRNVREIGIVQWDEEIVGMFSVPKGSKSEQSAQAAYRTYAAQVNSALRKGIAGQKTTSSDVDGSCNATFNAK